MNETLLPHVSFGTQSGGYLLQSYMILFQSSPVETAKRRRNELEKLLKFLRSSITSPDLTILNMKTPKIENIKNISINNKKTFKSDGIENMIVYIIACRPSAFPASLITLVTRKTLITRASCGPALNHSIPPPITSRKISKIDEITTKKSNLFHAF